MSKVKQTSYDLENVVTNVSTPCVSWHFTFQVMLPTEAQLAPADTLGWGVGAVGFDPAGSNKAGISQKQKHCRGWESEIKT